jgi:uncharacterized protein
MKRNCKHLPRTKRDELERVVSLITSSCDDVEMIVLFGSYARGTWKEEADLEPDRKSGHASDYDILVVVGEKSSAHDSGIWQHIERESRTLDLSTHIRVIAHDIEYLNLQLAKGQYFFSEIIEEGCLLHDAGRATLSDKREPTPREKRRIAQDYYDFWFDSAQGFFSLYTHALADNDLKRAAFLLHQSAEAAYKTVLLVFTGYSPHEHYLHILGRMAAESDAAMGDILPRDTREARERLELLDYAYIGARYDPTYRIAEEDLNLLSICVGKLLDRTKQICEAEIERLCPD